MVAETDCEWKNPDFRGITLNFNMFVNFLICFYFYFESSEVKVKSSEIRIFLLAVFGYHTVIHT